MIEKAIRRYPQYDVEEILFEYALCLRCYQDLSQRLSSESTLRLQQFMEQRTRLGDRAREMLDQYPDDPDAWLDQCIVEGQPLKESGEYTICAQAMGDQLILGVMPYGLSASAMDEMTTLLSAKTQDAFDDFRDNHVGGPPDVNEWLRERKRPVLI